jgi:hypothetical protein
VDVGLRRSRAAGRNVRNLGSKDPSYIGKLAARTLKLLDQAATVRDVAEELGISKTKAGRVRRSRVSEWEREPWSDG